MPRIRKNPLVLTLRARRFLYASFRFLCVRNIRRRRPRQFALILKALNRRKDKKDGINRGPPGPRLDFNNLPDDSFSLFRFDVDDLEPLAERLGLPVEIVTRNRDRASRREALAIVLRRLSYPCTMRQLRKFFGRSSGAVSGIFTHTVLLLHDRWADLLNGLDEERIRPRMAAFAASIERKGAPLDRVWAFIDGTLRPVCRPGIGQEDFYNGKDRIHGLKFQGVITPDGILVHMFGPAFGKAHDAGVFTWSEFEDHLRNMHYENVQYYLYGDLAYSLGPFLQKPFKGRVLDPLQQDFNTLMSRSRMAIEWGFNKITQLFPSLSWHHNQRILDQPVAVMYQVAALLANCHTCLYGSPTGQYFGVQPPSLEEYLTI